MTDKDKPGKPDKRKQSVGKVHTTDNPFTLHIDESPETLARILMTAPPKKAADWRYQQKRK